MTGPSESPTGGRRGNVTMVRTKPVSQKGDMPGAKASTGTPGAGGMPVSVAPRTQTSLLPNQTSA